jgi:pyruvate dehydrogenase E2 component (dihydrolipoamide acetyltransferase)
MATFQFVLPDIGEGVVEGEIVRWLVKVGDDVKEDQGLVDLMTDKATVTIPSPRAGRVTRIFGVVGEIAKVRLPLVDLEVEGDVAAVETAPRASAPRPSGPRPSALSGGVASQRVLATPVTRRMARELGIDLSKVVGTGPAGRVLKTDVEVFVTDPGGEPHARAGRPSAPPPPEGRDERIPLRGLRRKIAEKMVRSKQMAPHYTFVEEVDMTDLVRLRARFNEGLEDGGERSRLSFLPFFCKALVAAFQKFPMVNAVMDEEAQDLIVRGEYNIGVAAMTDKGLTVPVVKHVDRLSFTALAKEISRLAEAARQHRLTADELSGGTFTITSLGPQGGLFATPIINHPEVAILGVHRMRKRPLVLEDDQIAVRQVALLSFSFDHRTIDGALGAQFAYEFLRYVEKPELLFVDLL